MGFTLGETLGEETQRTSTFVKELRKSQNNVEDRSPHCGACGSPLLGGGSQVLSQGEERRQVQGQEGLLQVRGVLQRPVSQGPPCLARCSTRGSGEGTEGGSHRQRRDRTARKQRGRRELRQLRVRGCRGEHALLRSDAESEGRGLRLLWKISCEKEVV